MSDSPNNAAPAAVPVLWVLANDRPKADTISLLRWVRAVDASRVAIGVGFLDEPSGQPGPAGEADGTIPDALRDAGAEVCHWPAGRVVQGQALRSAEAYCRDRGVRVVHSIFLRADLFAARLARAMGLRWAATLGGVGQFRRERLYPAATVMDRMLYTRADRLVAVSAAVADDWRNRLGRPAEDFTVIHNAAPEPPATPPADVERIREEIALQPGELLAAAVSRLDREKGVESLVEAAALLRDRGVALRIAVAGDGRLRSDLERQIHDLDVPGLVTLLGDRRDVWTLLAAADLFVLPSHMEGCPNALLEAMAVGLPSVATGVGGTVELVAHERDALLYDPAAAPAALADAVARLAGDLELARRLGQSARTRARAEFPPAATAAAHADLYARLAGGHHG